MTPRASEGTSERFEANATHSYGSSMISGMMRCTIDHESTSTAIWYCVIIVVQLMIGVVGFSKFEHGKHKLESAAAAGSELEGRSNAFKQHQSNIK